MEKEKLINTNEDILDNKTLFKDETNVNEYESNYILNNNTSKLIISMSPINYFDSSTNKWLKIDNTTKESKSSSLKSVQVPINGFMETKVQSRTGEMTSFQDDNSLTGIHAYKTNSTEYRTNITIKRSLYNYSNNRITKVTLYLKSSQNSHGLVYINNQVADTIESNYNRYSIIDLTSLFKNTNNDFVFYLYAHTLNIDFTFSILDSYLEIEYLTDEISRPTYKTFSLLNKVDLEVNLSNGDCSIPINIINNYHSTFYLPINLIYKKDNNNYNLGENFRLNINEKLIKNTSSDLETDYIYTDELGNMHGFHEYFYHLDSNNLKQYLDIERNNITVDSDGTLKYNGNTIYNEFRSSTGLKLISTYEGFKLYNYIETRSDEIKEIEEKIETYKNVLSQYEVFHKNYAYSSYRYFIKNYLYSNNAFDSQMDFVQNSSDYLLLTSSDRVTYRQLLLQKEALELQVQSIDNESAGLNYSFISLDYQINTMDNTVFNSSLYIDSSYQEAINQNLITNYQNQIQLTDDQIDHCAELKTNIIKQKNVLQEQISLFETRSNDNIIEIKKYFKEYQSLLHKKEIIDRNSAYIYLTDGKIYKGFNKYGDLVSINDLYGNYSMIEYDKYFSHYISTFKISRIYDNLERSIKFDYLESGTLSSIIDTDGSRIEFTYTNNKLSIINYGNENSLNIEYDNDNYINRIIDIKNSLKVNLSFVSSRINRYQIYSLFSVIDLDSIIENDSIIETTSFSYTINSNNQRIESTIITNDNIKDGYYFDNNSNLIEYRREENSLVIDAERYEYKPYYIYDTIESDPHSKTIKANKSSLYHYSINNYSFINGDSNNSILNRFNNPISSSTSSIKVNDTGTNFKTINTSYTYDDNQKLVEEISTISYSLDDSSYTTHTIYYYDSYNRIIRTEKYSESEIYTNGYDIKEIEYDDYGNVIKEVSYNSLDSSTRYIKKNEYDSLNRVLMESNDLNDNSITYKYVRNTNLVNEEKTSNGVSIGYGYDKDDLISSISLSNNEAESNNNQIDRLKGLIVRTTSNGIEYKYRYDHKRRILKISSNVLPDIHYDYYENITHNCGVLTDVTSIADSLDNVYTNYYDKFGNLVESRYNGSSLLFCLYNNKELITSISDSHSRTSHSFGYDSLDRMTRHSITFFNNNPIHININYDDYGYLLSKVYNLNRTEGDTIDYTYQYNNDSKHNLSRSMNPCFFEYYDYDSLGRIKDIKQTFNNKDYITKYGYYKKSLSTVDRINSIYYYKDNVLKNKLSYLFDDNYNVTSVYDNDINTNNYKYDSINRLIKEEDLINDNIIQYTYDNRGNILSKNINGNAIYYKYEYNTNKLVKYSNEIINYDSLGNIIKLHNKDISYYRNGLVSSISDGENISHYEYDGFGIRRKKTCVASSSDYIYEDNKLLREIITRYDSNSTKVIDYIYGINGITGIKIDNTKYLFKKNLFGDVTHIYNELGNLVGEYSYTAFGECNIILDTNNIASINPIRYRSYYYDDESGLYYLINRYYDPIISRFISPDSFDYLDPNTINGLNLYAYCLNNPIILMDPMGNSAILTLIILGTIFGAAFGLGFDVGKQLINNDFDFSKINLGSAINSMIVGGALGFSFAMGVGFLGPVIAGIATAGGLTAGGAFAISTAVSFGAGALGYLIEERHNGRTPSFGKVMMHGGFVALEGMVKFVTGGIVGSLGNVGTKGKGVFSKERFGKLILGLEFSQPLKILIDLIRENI